MLPAKPMPGADLSIIRYAQCWEDADVLLDALAVQPGDVCVSVASGGENTLSLLSRQPSKVIAIDLSAAQLACLEIKAAAFRQLQHRCLLELVGATPSDRRLHLYAGLRDGLTPAARAFWDARPACVAAGIGSAGKFESYFGLFRRLVLPLIHTRERIDALFVPRDRAGRERFCNEIWENRRWRWLVQLFFSRFVMGRLGRDPGKFRYVEADVAEVVLQRMHRAMTELDPAANPYLQWIAYGQYRDSLPHALRPENFALIRANLDRLQLRCESLDEFLDAAGDDSIDRFNLSDVFEYLSEAETGSVFAAIARAARSGGRVVYWNMMARRARPAHLAHRLIPNQPVADKLYPANKAAFYDALRVEDVA